jgi:hypothetical protein
MHRLVHTKVTKVGKWYTGGDNYKIDFIILETNTYRRLVIHVPKDKVHLLPKKGDVFKAKCEKCEKYNIYDGVERLRYTMRYVIIDTPLDGNILRTLKDNYFLGNHYKHKGRL